MAERKRNADGTFRRKHRKGLGEAESTKKRVRRVVASKSPKYIDGAKKGGAIVAGLLVASVGRGVLNKIMPAPAAGTGVNTSSLILDLALVGGGIFLAGSSKNELLQYVGYGVAANGVAGVIKSVTQKDLLATGLSGTDLNDVVSGLGLGAADEVSGLGNMQMIDLSTIPSAPAAPVRGIGATDEVSGFAATEDMSGFGAASLYNDMGFVEV